MVQSKGETSNDQNQNRILIVRLSSSSSTTTTSTTTTNCAHQGETIFAQGDIGKEFFMICLGAVNIVVDGNTVARFGAGKGFGELALVNENSTRAATIVAAKDRTLVGVLHGSTCVYACSWKIIDERVTTMW